MPEKKIKIAYIIDTLATASAGTEKQLLFLLKHLNRDKFEPHLICFYKSDWMKNNELPCQTHFLEMHSLFSMDLFKSSKRFKALHKEIDFDLMQTFFRDGNIVGTYCGWRANVHPLISSRRNAGYWHDKKHISILKFLRRWTDYYLSNSKAAGQVTSRIEDVDPKKIHVIYNGLDLKPFEAINDEMRRKQRAEWNISDDEILIGTVANLRPIKNIDSLIKAASTLTEKYNNLKFVVIGEGDDRDRLQNKIDSLNLIDRFNLAGRFENVIPALAAFDIAVLPSSNESLSNSLIEYMAAGKPVVCGDVGGNGEAIDNHKTGLLYDPTLPDSMAEKLRELLDHPDIARQYGLNGVEKVNSVYALDKMVLNHEQFYENIIRG